MADYKEIFPLEPGRAQILVTRHDLIDAKNGFIPVRVVEQFPVSGPHIYEKANDDNNFAEVRFATNGRIFCYIKAVGLSSPGQGGAKMRNQMTASTKAFLKLAEMKMPSKQGYMISIQGKTKQNYSNEFLMEGVIKGCVEHWRRRDNYDCTIPSAIGQIAIVPDPQDPKDSTEKYKTAAANANVVLSTHIEPPFFYLPTLRNLYDAYRRQLDQTGYIKPTPEIMGWPRRPKPSSNARCPRR